MEYTEKEVQRVYRKFYRKLLLILPVKDLVLDFYHRELLSNYHKTIIDKCSDESDKKKYFLDNVIYLSMQVGEFTQFNKMLTLMGRSDDIAVKSVADKIRKKLSPSEPSDHSGKASKCRGIRVIVTKFWKNHPYGRI